MFKEQNNQDQKTEEVPDKIIEYAWNWFEYHARQRLTSFRFFLVLLGIVVVAVRYSLEKQQFGFAGLIGLVSLFVSLAFLALEIRNKQLVDIGRNALQELENSSDFHKLERETSVLKLAEKSVENRHWFYSYWFWLRGLFLICSVLSIALIAYTWFGINFKELFNLLFLE